MTQLQVFLKNNVRSFDKERDMVKFNSHSHFEPHIPDSTVYENVKLTSKSADTGYLNKSFLNFIPRNYDFYCIWHLSNYFYAY